MMVVRIFWNSGCVFSSVERSADMDAYVRLPPQLAAGISTIRMNRTFTCVVIAALSLFIGQPAAGASAEGALGLPPLEDGAYQTLVDRVNAGQVSEYDQVLAS